MELYLILVVSQKRYIKRFYTDYYTKKMTGYTIAHKKEDAMRIVSETSANKLVEQLKVSFQKDFKVVEEIVKD